MKIIKKVRGYKPLHYCEGGIILSRGYEIYKADYALNDIRYVGSVPSSLTKRVLCKFRLTARLLRLDIGASRYVQASRELLVCCSSSIFSIKLDEANIKLDFNIPKGSKPLSLVTVDVPGFEEGVYYGEYLSNPKKESVRIFRRSPNGSWSVAYTFPDGEINHIHSIIQHRNGGSLFILTGDFGEGAAIWEATDGFRNVKRIVSAGQSSRACWMAMQEGKFYFATDTQLDFNYASSFDLNEKDVSKVVKIFPILGSSIYSLSMEGGMIFSTAVEPDEIKGNKFFALFSRKIGPGIICEKAAIYSWVFQGAASLVITAKKDILPFRLFQFGSFQFPSGEPPPDGSFHAYGVGLSKYDNTTIYICNGVQADD